MGFTYQDGRLISDSVQLCGFVYLVSADEGERSGPITEDTLVKLHWDRDQAVDLDALRGVLDQPRHTTWAGITLAGDEPHDGIWLRLTATDHRVCRIDAHPEVTPELCDPVEALRSPALVDGSSLAYLSCRRQEHGGEVRWELGALGHGPAAAELVEQLCDEVRAWAIERDRRTPTVIVYPAGTPDNELTGPAIDKTHSRLMITYGDNAAHIN